MLGKVVYHAYVGLKVVEFRGANPLSLQNEKENYHDADLNMRAFDVVGDVFLDGVIKEGVVGPASTQ